LYRTAAPTASHQIEPDLDTSPQPFDDLRARYLARRTIHECAWHAERDAREQARTARRALLTALEADAADQIGREIDHARMGAVTIVGLRMGDLKLYPLVRRTRFKTGEVALFDWAFDHSTREWGKP
jgi:hypothetical protein